jgi:hypothetical protein
MLPQVSEYGGYMLKCIGMKISVVELISVCLSTLKDIIMSVSFQTVEDQYLQTNIQYAVKGLKAYILHIK